MIWAKAHEIFWNPLIRSLKRTAIHMLQETIQMLQKQYICCKEQFKCCKNNSYAAKTIHMLQETIQMLQKQFICCKKQFIYYKQSALAIWIAPGIPGQAVGFSPKTTPQMCKSPTPKWVISPIDLPCHYFFL